MLKYKIIDFVTDLNRLIMLFKEDALEPYYISDPIPIQSENSLVKSVVGENFEEMVYSSGKYILLRCYTDSTDKDNENLILFKKVADKLSDNRNLVFLQMEMARNEVKDFVVTKFPSLRLFKPDIKQPIKYEDEQTEKRILNFLEENMDDDLDIIIDEDL